jgi:hypothetical protein
MLRLVHAVPTVVLKTTTMDRFTAASDQGKNMPSCQLGKPDFEV